VEHIELFLLFQHFTTARAHMALGDEKKARGYVTMLREFGRNLNRVCDFCEASVLLSALDWACGNKKEAAAVLELALEKLQRYGYARLVIDEGASILPVLKRIAAKTRQPDYAGPLRREFLSGLVLETHRFAKLHKGVAANLANNQKPVKLSKQQTAMLTLLEKGYSNAMIVAETGLKITTVKTHTAIAYQKLGVNNAMDAVLKARDLGLI
jgi:LuxR family maltose regulon positive regulatory protein